VAGALTAAILVLTRRRPQAQIVALVALGIVLLALALTVPTVAVLSL